MTSTNKSLGQESQDGRAVRKSPKPKQISLIVISASAGGPQSLAEVIPALMGELDVPVLIVQHMPALFTHSMASMLDRKSALSVKEAEPKETLTPGKVLIAPGGRHLVVRKQHGELMVDLDDGPPVRKCRPSADVLLKSIDGLADETVLTVTMTGMGMDGADGLESMSRSESYNLVQDEETSIVYGMPKEVKDRGLADEILPLKSIAPRINQLIRRATYRKKILPTRQT